MAAAETPAMAAWRLVTACALVSSGTVRIENGDVTLVSEFGRWRRGYRQAS
jgi:hypothetical protein